VVKKAERVAKAIAREARRQQYAREEAAMKSFLVECQACLPPDVWETQYEEARRSAGKTFHIVEWMVSVLASTQQPITPSLRRALDAMLDALGMDRGTTVWNALR
jgi:hypothetical protein